MSLSEYHARRARLGFAPPIRQAVVIMPAKALPAPKPPQNDNIVSAIVSKFRCVLDTRTKGGTLPSRNIFAMRHIMEEVALEYRVTVLELVSPSRKSPVVRARQAAYWRANRETQLSLHGIGRHFGGKDHTTVLHGIRKHQARIDAGTVGP
jgi:hypothetical protein